MNTKHSMTMLAPGIGRNGDTPEEADFLQSQRDRFTAFVIDWAKLACHPKFKFIFADVFCDGPDMKAVFYFETAKAARRFGLRCLKANDDGIDKALAA